MQFRSTIHKASVYQYDQKRRIVKMRIGGISLKLLIKARSNRLFEI